VLKVGVCLGDRRRDRVGRQQREPAGKAALHVVDHGLLADVGHAERVRPIVTAVKLITWRAPAVVSDIVPSMMLNAARALG
jgi:hypothetical protein